MRNTDIIVGKKYRMKTELALFVKEGAIVKVLSVDDASIYVQDLSRNKYLDGKWFVHCDDLQPLKGSDPEEIKVGLRVNHEDCGAGTVTYAGEACFRVMFDKKHPRFDLDCIFSYSFDVGDRWSCAALSLLTEEDDDAPKLTAVSPLKQQKSFKAGDLVRCAKQAVYRRTSPDVVCRVKKVYADGIMRVEITEGMHKRESYDVNSTYFEKVEQLTLDVQRTANKITVTLGETQASASCSPDDTFDYLTGVQIALARLAQKCGKPVTVYLPKDTKDFKIEFV